MYAGLSFFAKLVASTASFMRFEAHLLILVVAPFDITLSLDYMYRRRLARAYS